MFRVIVFDKKQAEPSEVITCTTKKEMYAKGQRKFENTSARYLVMFDEESDVVDKKLF